MLDSWVPDSLGRPPAPPSDASPSHQRRFWVPGSPDADISSTVPGEKNTLSFLAKQPLVEKLPL